MSEDYAAAAGVRGREAPDGSGEGPAGGSGNPGQPVAEGVEACLALAAAWHAWGGRPVARPTVAG